MYAVYAHKLSYCTHEDDTDASAATSCENNECAVGSVTLIDRQHVQNQMFCLSCKDSLLLHNIVSERVVGLGTVFVIKCAKCEKERFVTSSPLYKHPDSQNYNREMFAVNSKIFLGKYFDF